MSDYRLTRVLEVLRGLYGRVQTLEEFIDAVVFNDGRKPVLLEESDSVRFKALIKGLIVCTESPLTHTPSSAQVHTHTHHSASRGNKLHTCVAVTTL